MRLAELSIFLFDLGEAILPSRPQFDCAAVSSGGQGWPPLGGHPKGSSLTAASTVAGFVTRGEKAIITAGDFLLHFPCPLQRLGSGSGKAIKNRAFSLIRKPDPAHWHEAARAIAAASVSAITRPPRTQSPETPQRMR